MDLGLKGKVALVTGAGSQKGYGKGIVLVLAREGCDIIATDKDLEGAKQTAAEVEALGRKAIALKADVTKKAEVNDMVKAGLEKFGKIDILVNNAGIASGMRPFVNTTEEDWDTDINVNFKGTMYCTHAVLPQMIERKSGKIVNITTPAAAMTVTSLPDMSTYAAAKAAIIHFSKGLSAEVGPLGINVNIIAPGTGDTGLAKASGVSQEWLDMLKEMAAAGKTIPPQDIGNTVAYLVSDMSPRVHGQVIAVLGAPQPHH
jgi:NAD(P)-dependent dehydrogenase (short-subunit alcohol dehydrogenase family)